MSHIYTNDPHQLPFIGSVGGMAAGITGGTIHGILRGATRQVTTMPINNKFMFFNGALWIANAYVLPRTKDTPSTQYESFSSFVNWFCMASIMYPICRFNTTNATRFILSKFKMR